MLESARAHFDDKYRLTYKHPVDIHCSLSTVQSDIVDLTPCIVRSVARFNRRTIQERGVDSLQDQ